jgi:hypothetical protein
LNIVLLAFKNFEENHLSGMSLALVRGSAYHKTNLASFFVVFQ